MSHYFTNDYVKSQEKEIEVKIKNQTLSFITDNGIFSKNNIDYATKFLLENLPSINGEVLDFGCGYGPIGIYIAKTYKINVDMLDINQRALNLAKRNSTLNGVSTNVFYSNMFENVSKKYDFIVTNPPIRIGKQNLYKIIKDSKKYLKENGLLIFVINKNQGAKTLIKDLKNIYNFEIINKNKGFYVIKAEIP